MTLHSPLPGPQADPMPPSAVITKARCNVHWGCDRDGFNSGVIAALTPSNLEAANLWLALRIAIEAGDIDGARRAMAELEHPRPAARPPGDDLDAVRIKRAFER